MFIIISELDYDISSLVTGLGLTSVVIALAAQDLAESLLSGMAIVSDKPFLVGDTVKIGNYQGTVTDVKFRCTRIRTSEDTIVTIQNSTIINSEVVNLSRMTKRRLEISVNLPLETRSDVLENLTIMLKSVLEAEEEVIDDSVRAYFDSIGEGSVKLSIYLYTNIVNYDEYLEFKTRMNLLVMKTLEMDNVKLAYPGKNVYMPKQ